jgi:hypothetical protein
VNMSDPNGHSYADSHPDQGFGSRLGKVSTGGNYTGSQGWSGSGSSRSFVQTNCSNCFPSRIDLRGDGTGGLLSAGTAFGRQTTISISDFARQVAIIAGMTTLTPAQNALISFWSSPPLPPQVTPAMISAWTKQAMAAKIVGNLPGAATTKLAWFASRYMSSFKKFSGGPWDIKVYGKQYEALGNALYGYLGSAAGFSEATLRFAAGASQAGGPLLGGGLGQFGNGYFGDDPPDFPNVSIGINSWHSGIDASQYLQ